MDKPISIYKALAEVQKEVGALERNETNPFFKNSYININGTLEAVQPVLHKHNLVVTQPLVSLEGKPALKTILASTETEQTIESIIVMEENPDPQKMGSAITYYRRYALISLLGLPTADKEDDDGNAASTTTKQDNNFAPF